MDTQGAMPGALTPPGGWPASPAEALALNRLGVFDWDLDEGLLYLDPTAIDVLGVDPEKFNLKPESLTSTMSRSEASRLDLLISQAIKEGRSGYGVYFQVRTPTGEARWTHTQAHILRTRSSRPYRILGLVRDATSELRQPTDRLTLESVDEADSNVVEEITAALSTARSVRDVLDVLESRRGLRRLGAVSLLLGLVEGSHMKLISQGRAARHVPELEVTRLDADYPMNEVARTMKPIYFTSRNEIRARHPRLWPHVEPLEVSAAVYLPLIAQAKVIGSIGLLYREKHTFTSRDRTLLNAMTSGIAQSLQRAKLFDQGRELAEGLQRFMLPHSIPKLPGVETAVSYRPAGQLNEIGGDWYDVIPLPGGRVAAVIGDVQGHDTHAAAVMGQLRIVLRAYAAEGHIASTVMARASTFLADLDTDRFATCLYAEIDPSTGWVQVVRAGHLDPLLLQGDGTCRPVSVPGSLPLGLHLGPSAYQETALELEVGETLLMYTDGLVEHPSRDIDEGVRQLAASTARGPKDLRQLADWVVESPRAVGGADDIAVLLLRRDVPVDRQVGRRLRKYIAPGDLGALNGIRQMIRAATKAWRVEEHSEEIALTAHELVTNAVLHTDAGVVVTVRLLGGARLRVEVEDRSAEHPTVRQADDWHRTGRGLLLVDQLADVWGVESRGEGKCVWCEFLSPDGRTD